MTKDKKEIAGTAEIERDCPSMIKLEKQNEEDDLTGNILVEIKAKGGLGFEKKPFYIHFVPNEGWATRNKDKLENIEQVIGIITKAVINKEFSEDNALAIKRFKFEQHQEIIDLAHKAIESNMNESQIREKLDALKLADDDRYSYLQEFVEFSSSQRNMKKLVSDTYTMLGIGKTKYHETITEYILESHKRNVDIKFIADKIGWKQKEVKEVIEKKQVMESSVEEK